MAKNKQRGLIFLPVVLVLVLGLLLWGTALADNNPPGKGYAYGKKKDGDANPNAALYPATERPDAILLTPGGDTATSITISWRTAPTVTNGVVQYRSISNPKQPQAEVFAKYDEISDERLVNDPVNSRFSATLNGLEPRHHYAYRVGSKLDNAWSAWYDFYTAPGKDSWATFVYLGDVQGSAASVKHLLTQIEANPNLREIDFYLIGGDIVNSGGNRNEYDALLADNQVFRKKMVAATIGNHDYFDTKADQPEVYNKYFNFPPNGAKAIPANHSYSFVYGNAYFIVLDSNREVKKQTAWLENELAKAQAYYWKVVMFHHPVYSAVERRDNVILREAWTSLFDKYGVDLVLTGHDHVYMRSHMVKQGKLSQDQGTVYLIAAACDKTYDIEKDDFAAVKLSQTPTYQVIEMVPENSPGLMTLEYKAYDFNDKLVDSFVLSKPRLVKEQY